jgi:hypothetical protein
VLNELAGAHKGGAMHLPGNKRGLTFTSCDKKALEGLYLPRLRRAAAAELPRKMLQASAYATLQVDGDTTHWPLVAFLDDTTLISFCMRGMQRAADVMSDEADETGGLFSRKKTHLLQLRLGVSEEDGQLAAPLPPLPQGVVDSPLAGGAKAPREDCVISLRCLHGPAGADKHRVRRRQVDVGGRPVDDDLMVAEYTRGKVLGDWLQNDGKWEVQGTERAKRGRAKERRLAQMGGWRGGLAMADAAVVREAVIDSALLLRSLLSGYVAAGARGMSARRHSELLRVQRRSVRVITGAPKYAAWAATYAEVGVISLTLAAAVEVMRFWGRLRKYEARAPIRRAIMGVVRRELNGASGAARNWVGKRFVIAAALVCGPQAAAARLADESSSQTAWATAVQGDVEQAVQREYERQLQRTATGRRLLVFKPKFGLAAYLLVAAADANISPLAVVRLMQFRTHGHHLQDKADQFRGDGRSSGCRCGSEREDPPHLFFACAATATERQAMVGAIEQALAPVAGAMDGLRRLQPDDALGKWIWLNALLDVRNPGYRAALPAVLKAVTEFIKQVLAKHPLYARRR